MARQGIALGHIGMLLGMLAVMLMIWMIYAALAPYPNGSYMFFPLLAWGLGLMFAVGEWFELKRAA